MSVLLEYQLVQRCVSITHTVEAGAGGRLAADIEGVGGVDVGSKEGGEREGLAPVAPGENLPGDWHPQAVQAAGQGVAVLHKGRFNNTGRRLHGDMKQ